MLKRADEVQTALANIRTDLDSFTHNEAQALMLSGYEMTSCYCPKKLTENKPSLEMPEWGFQRLAAVVKEEQSSHELLQQLLQQLQVGKQVFFKVWTLSRSLKRLSWIILLLIVWGLYLWLPAHLNHGYKLTIGTIVSLLAIAFVNRFLGPWFFKIIRYKKTLKAVALGSIALFLGAIVAQIHIQLFDRLFLKIGRNLKRKGKLNSVQGESKEVD